MKKILLSIMLLPALVFSQEKRALSIEEAIQIGMENSRALHISSMKVLAADAKSSEANAARLPSLKLQAGYARLSEIDPFAVSLPFLPSPVTISPIVLNNYTTRLSLQQPLFTGFKLEKSAAAAEYSAEAASNDFAKDKLDLVFNIKSAYWNLYKAREIKRVVDENVELMKAHLGDVQNMMAQGLVTKNEMLKVQVQLSSSQLSQIDASNLATIAMMSLNNLIGLPIGTEIDLTSAIQPQAMENRQLAEITQEAVEARADLKAAGMRVQASEASVTATKGSWYPQVSLYGNYYYSRPNPRILPTRDEFKDTWDFGVNLSFDVWNWNTTKHQTDQAEATLTQSREALEQLKDAIILEVNQSYLMLLQSKEKVSVAENGVEQADENYRITKNKFTSGTATNTDLLDAEVALLQAKVNRTLSLVDYELAQARIMKVVGREK
ncbi:MAG: TolC family protein [Bacteroidota bacterium]